MSQADGSAATSFIGADPFQLRSRYGLWAMIAGGSEGTGAEFARQLAAAGIHCVLIARRRDPLNALAHEIMQKYDVQVRTACIDLSDPDATTHLLREAEGLDLGLFIYNAGGDPSGKKFLDATLNSWQGLVRRNVDTLLSSCYEFGQRFIRQRRGGLVIVGSDAAFGGASRINVYSATKAFGLNLGESLWAELKPFNVDVLNVLLGSTDTPTLRSALARNNIPPESLSLALPEDVVRRALAAIPHGPTLVMNEPADSNDPLRSGNIRREQVTKISEFLTLFYGEDS